MSDDGNRVARERASRDAEFRDSDQEFRETKGQSALRRRHKAMRKGTTSDFRRGGEKLHEVTVNERTGREDRLKRAKFTGWKEIKE